MTDSEHSASIDEFRQQVGESWFNVRAFLSDRRRILSDPSTMVSPSAGLAFTPLRFAAFISVVLTTTLASALVLIATTLTPGAPSLFQARVDFVQGLSSQLHDRFGSIEQTSAELTPTQSALAEPMRELELHAYLALDDATRSAAKSDFSQRLDGLTKTAQPDDVRAVVARLDAGLARTARVARFEARVHDSGAYNAILTGLAGLLLLVNGLVFRWIILRQRGEFPHANRADRVFLYYLPARQLWFYLAQLLFVLAANLANLYQRSDWLIAIAGFSFALLFATLAHLWRCAPAMAQALSAITPAPPQATRQVISALVGCMVASGAILTVLWVALDASLLVLGFWIG